MPTARRYGVRESHIPQLVGPAAYKPVCLNFDCIMIYSSSLFLKSFTHTYALIESDDHYFYECMLLLIIAMIDIRELILHDVFY